MLWLALHFPHLPLEALARPPDGTAFAVVSRERIVACDDTARAAGIEPGQRLAGAWARLPTLTVQERDDVRETATLRRLACWAGAFTSEICLPAPHTLLLEIAGSLRLFGGAEALCERIVTGCREQGFQPLAALAPTPLAAEWLAIGGKTIHCTDATSLPANLSSMPLAALPVPEADTTRLAAFGARTLGDVLKLPRAGLARRLGAAWSLWLAKALGEYPDPRPRFVFPEEFCERLELPAAVEHAPALLFAARRLIAALCGWLALRQVGILECRLTLEHDLHQQPVSQLALGFADATRDPERMIRVLAERLQSLPLPSTVTALRLTAATPQPLAGHTPGLFGGAGHSRAGDDRLAVLVEQLQARLGPEKVHGLAVVADHRPEMASRPVPPLGRASTPSARTDRPPRPLWLLPRPQALAERGGQPQHGGPLRLLAGPERLESGWWDGGEDGAFGDLRRDYFVALSPRAEWLWIFRDAEGWFLHGLFA